MTDQFKYATPRPWTLQTAIDQIESCNFACEGGPLSNNVAWIWLTSNSYDPEREEKVKALVEAAEDVLLIHDLDGQSKMFNRLRAALKAMEG